MTHATATVDLMRPPFPAEPGSGVYSNKLGMWVFLASDVMFFTALIGTYIILRFGVSEPWARPNAVLNVPLTAFNTFLLICSSVSMVKAFAAISQGDQRGLKLWQIAANAFTIEDRKSTRLNSSHGSISYAVFCLKKKTDKTRAH